MSDSVSELSVPMARVGALLRRDLRAAIRAAETLGAEVEWSGTKGLLDSMFTIKATGTLAQFAPLLDFICSTSSSSTRS